ncbi:MAG: efflux RND transporter periplasmic adaptor subunit [Gemmatimonadales bacterium]|nr:MAG: efflux RND transporter periplasmic adaptor subunit [Gemmatimonadales bacterium]
MTRLHTAPAHALLFLLAALFLLSGCGWGHTGNDHDDHGDHASEQEDPDSHDDHGDHGEAGRDGDMVQVSGDMARRLGITLVEARTEALEREVRAPGEVRWDETRLSTVSLRFGGWAERLHVDFTGRFVEAGAPLLEVYSPELVSAQEDLLAARVLADELSGSRVPGSVDRSDAALRAARERLRRWQVDSADIEAVEASGEVLETITLRSPRSGFVVEKAVQAGERFESGAALYRLADLSVVWVEVEVYERDLRFVRIGDEVRLDVAAHPDRPFHGEVSYLYPEVDPERRTARIRVEVPNPDLELRPGMYGTARTTVTLGSEAVTVPRDAVLHAGDRSLVFVAHGDDGFMIHEVQIGMEAGGRVQILSGVEAGEQVVARAGFILDAESRLMDAMSGMPGMHGDHDGHGDHGGHGDHDDHDDPDDDDGHDDHGHHDDHDDHDDHEGQGGGHA